MILLLDVGDAIKVLLDNQTLIHFVNESINGILENKFNTPSKKIAFYLKYYHCIVEEFLILMLVYKMLYKENQIVPLLATRNNTIQTA